MRRELESIRRVLREAFGPPVGLRGEPLEGKALTRWRDRRQEARKGLLGMVLFFALAGTAIWQFGTGQWEWDPYGHHHNNTHMRGE